MHRLIQEIRRQFDPEGNATTEWNEGGLPISRVEIGRPASNIHHRLTYGPMISEGNHCPSTFHNHLLDTNRSKAFSPIQDKAMLTFQHLANIAAILLTIGLDGYSSHHVE